MKVDFGFEHTATSNYTNLESIMETLKLLEAFPFHCWFDDEAIYSHQPIYPWFL